MKKGRRDHCVRRVFANFEKVAMVDEWKKSGHTQSDFERDHKLPATSISKWSRLVEKLQACDPAGLRGRLGVYPALEAELLAWAGTH